MHYRQSDNRQTSYDTVCAKEGLSEAILGATCAKFSAGLMNLSPRMKLQATCIREIEFKPKEQVII